MLHQTPEIHAVVEVIAHDGAPWFDLPPEPWPEFVRLSRASTEAEVALLVATLCHYGRGDDEPADSAEALAKTFSRILPGGFAVIGNGQTFFPGCCCGLEMWQEWLNVVSSGQGPWTGHDPAMLIEVKDGNVSVSQEGALGSNTPLSEASVVFTNEQFEEAVRMAAADLEGFIVPLGEWLEKYAPSQAGSLTEQFHEVFVSAST